MDKQGLYYLFLTLVKKKNKVNTNIADPLAQPRQNYGKSIIVPHSLLNQ
jgi:hypothetical protein